MPRRAPCRRNLPSHPSSTLGWRLVVELGPPDSGLGAIDEITARALFVDQPGVRRLGVAVPLDRGLAIAAIRRLAAERLHAERHVELAAEIARHVEVALPLL